MLFTMICVAVCGLRAQQRMEVQKNIEGKKVDAAFVREAKYLGQYDGLYCFVGDGHKHRKRLVLVDHNMEPLRVMELPESSANCDVMAGSISGNTVSMLLVDNDPRGTALVFRGSYDLDSMRPADGGRGLELLDSVSFGRHDRCLVWAGTSPSAVHNAMVLIVEYTERNQYSAHAVLFDAQMREVWHYDYAMGSMNDLHVTDEGSIVTLGYDREGEETHLVFNIMDSKRGDTSTRGSRPRAMMCAAVSWACRSTWIPWCSRALRCGLSRTRTSMCCTTRRPRRCSETRRWIWCR